MKKFKAIHDFLWVFQAFMRGKVLRQKVYCSQENFFRMPVPANVKRTTMLMKWWGYRPASEDDLREEARERMRFSYGGRVFPPSREELAEWEKHGPPNIGIRI